MNVEAIAAGAFGAVMVIALLALVRVCIREHRRLHDRCPGCGARRLLDYCKCGPGGWLP